MFDGECIVEAQCSDISSAGRGCHIHGVERGASRGRFFVSEHGIRHMAAMSQTSRRRSGRAGTIEGEIHVQGINDDNGIQRRKEHKRPSGIGVVENSANNCSQKHPEGTEKPKCCSHRTSGFLRSRVAHKRLRADNGERFSLSHTFPKTSAQIRATVCAMPVIIPACLLPSLSLPPPFFTYVVIHRLRNTVSTLLSPRAAMPDK